MKEEETKYKLTGIVVHSGGSANSGHYYAFVQSSAGDWYRMDDQDVSKSLSGVSTSSLHLNHFRLAKSVQRPF